MEESYFGVNLQLQDILWSLGEPWSPLSTKAILAQILGPFSDNPNWVINSKIIKNTAADLQPNAEKYKNQGAVMAYSKSRYQPDCNDIGGPSESSSEI